MSNVLMLVICSALGVGYVFSDSLSATNPLAQHDSYGKSVR